MIANVLKKIAYEDLASVREIATVTGRGESTVYRWMNGESQPDYASIRKLANELPSVEARQLLLDHFTHRMPVAFTWTEGQAASPISDRSACPPVSACIEALDHVADAMRLINIACTQQAMSRQQSHEATSLLNRGIDALVQGRQLLHQTERHDPEAVSVAASAN